MAGLSDVTMITEPEAAAAHYAANERIADGTTVAVYDLGGGTFDATVLRTTGGGFEILGDARGRRGARRRRLRRGRVRPRRPLPRRRGVRAGPRRTRPPPARSSRLRQDCVLAKEALSSDTEATIPVLLPVAADRGPPDPRRVRDDDPPLGGVDDRLAAARPGVGRHLRRAGGHGAAGRRVVAHPAGLPDGLGRARASRRRSTRTPSTPSSSARRRSPSRRPAQPVRGRRGRRTRRCSRRPGRPSGRRCPASVRARRPAASRSAAAGARRRRRPRPPTAGDRAPTPG